MPLTPEEQAELDAINEQLSLAEQSVKQNISSQARADAERMSGVGQEGVLESLLIGAGRAPSNIGKSIQQLTTFDPVKSQQLREEVDQERQLMSKIGSPIAAAAGEFAGDVATFAIPGAGVAKGVGYLGRVSNTVNRLNSAAKASKLGKIATSTPKTLLGKAGKYAGLGAAGGSVGGFTSTVGTGETRAGNTLTGAALGAILAPAAGAGINKLLIPGAKMAGKASKSLVNRIKGVSDKADNKPANKVVKDYLKDAKVTETDLRKAVAVAEDFKDKGLEHITPPIKSILRNDLLDERLNRMISTDAAQDYVLLKNVDVNKEMDRLSNELDQLVGLSDSMSNSQLLDTVPKAAAMALSRAKGVAQKASEDFYEAASRNKVELGKVSNFLKSPVVQKTMKDIKKDPEYADILHEIDTTLVRMEPEPIKQARLMVNKGREDFDKLWKLPDGQRTRPQNEFIQDYLEAKSIVDEQAGFMSLAHLDLVSRALRERATKLRTKATREGSSATKAARAEQVAGDFNNLLKELSPELRQAKDAYSQNIGKFMDLQQKGMARLAGADKGQIKGIIKQMNNTNPEDFSDIVKALNAQQPGLGDEVGKLWLVDKLEAAAKTDRNALRNLSGFFTSKANLKKTKEVITDPDAQKLMDRIALIAKYYTQPTAKGTPGGRLGIPIGDYSAREISRGVLEKLTGFATNKKVRYLLDSSKWPGDIKKLLKAQNNKKETLLSTDELLSALISLSVGKE